MTQRGFIKPSIEEPKLSTQLQPKDKSNFPKYASREGFSQTLVTMVHTTHVVEFIKEEPPNIAIVTEEN